MSSRAPRKLMMFGYNVLSPFPTFIVALATVGASFYFGIPIWKTGLCYTIGALTIGAILSLILGIPMHIENRNQPDGFLAEAIMFIAPTGIAIYKIGLYWIF